MIKGGSMRIRKIDYFFYDKYIYVNSGNLFNKDMFL
jgi:hypothetical protein